MVIIGIDPDLTKPGVCIMQASGEFDLVKKYSMSKLLEDIPNYASQGFIFAVENCSEVKTIYARNRKGGTAEQAKIAQNVGQVKGAQVVLCNYIEHCGGELMLVPVGAGKQVKNNSALFRKMTGYTGRTNEDDRDAWAIANYARNKLGR